MVHVQYPAMVGRQTCDFAVALSAAPGYVGCAAGEGSPTRIPTAQPLTDAATLERIRDLVIPPAWKKVWICPYPNGHIQAVGTDAAGRRQYLYHQKWQEERNEEKFDRVLEMSAALPDMRRRIAADLRRRGLERDRVLALALHLLDLGYFRAGGEQYAEENNSYGIATLLCEHVALQQGGRRVRLPGQERGAPHAADRRSGGGPVGAGTAAPSRAAPSDSWCAATVPVGPTSRRRPQRAVQGTGRRRVHGQGSAHLARHGAGAPRRSSMRILR